MYEIFTVGGGTYLVTVFNAVAALGGSTLMASMIVIVAGVSFIWVLFQTALGGSWMANLKWLTLFLVIYMGLFLPRVTVKVTDLHTPALPGAIVANVPFGLAFFASMTSGAGKAVTEKMEAVFALPNDVRYQTSGMIFGARMVEESSRWRIADPVFAGNVSRMVRQCVFYGIMLGHIDLNELRITPDVWQFIETNAASPLRAFDYRTRTAAGESRTIVPCARGIADLARQWRSQITVAQGPFARSLFPGVSDETAKRLLLSRLPVSHTYLIGVSRDAGAIMRQQMMINALDDGMRDWLSEVGNDAALNGYMKARADLQTRAVYKTTGLQAEKWVPMLRIVFECLYYGGFPIALVLMLTPLGLTVVRGYFSGFVWLQSWGPLYAILHYIVMEGLAAETQAQLAGNGIALVSQLGVRSVIQDTAAMAGYLSMSVPFIALGLMFGASRFASLATSMLAPAQRAAGTAAEEGTQGNISWGNTSFDTHAFNRLEANRTSTSASFNTGVFDVMTGGGGRATTFAGGAQAVDASGTVSQTIWSAQAGTQVRNAVSEQIGEQRSFAASESERYSQSATAAYNDALSFGRTAANSSSYTTAEGHAWQNQVRDAHSQLQSAAENLSQNTGLSMEQSAQLIASAGLGGDKGIFKGGLSGKYMGQGQTREHWQEAQNIAEQYQVQQNFETLRTASQNTTFSQGNEEVARAGDTMTASHNRAESHAADLNTTLSRVENLERLRSDMEENSASFNLNLANRALEIGAGEHNGSIVEAEQAARNDPDLGRRWSRTAADELVESAVNGHRPGWFTDQPASPAARGGADGIGEAHQRDRRTLNENAVEPSGPSPAMQANRDWIGDANDAIDRQVEAGRTATASRSEGDPGQKAEVERRANQSLGPAAFEQAKDHFLGAKDFLADKIGEANKSLEPLQDGEKTISPGQAFERQPEQQWGNVTVDNKAGDGKPRDPATAPPSDSGGDKARNDRLEEKPATGNRDGREEPK